MESPGVELGTATVTDGRPYILGHEELYIYFCKDTNITRISSRKKYFKNYDIIFLSSEAQQGEFSSKKKGKLSIHIILS